MGLAIGFIKSKRLSSIIDNQDQLSNGTFIWCDQTERLYVKMKDKIIGVTPAKRSIKKISCVSCGSPLILPETGSICKCEYCGAVYDIDNYDMDISKPKEKERIEK